MSKSNVIDGYSDGYHAFPLDGYNCDWQLNVKLTGMDMQDIANINKQFYDGSIPNSTLGRILIRRGIKSFKNFK